jgi:hypothetical protein
LVEKITFSILFFHLKEGVHSRRKKSTSAWTPGKRGRTSELHLAFGTERKLHYFGKNETAHGLKSLVKKSYP